MAREEKEQRKEHERIQREHGRMEELERTANEIDQRRMVSNSLDQIADNTRLFQDLVNIQIPLYHPVGPSPPFIPTSAGANSIYPFPTTPTNPGLASTSQSYGFSIPPWLQAANWHQSNAIRYTHSNQENIGISTYMAVAGDSTTLGNGETQPH